MTAAAYPVRTLREHITELEAAMAVCLAGPGKRPVHKLRSQTRRIEAQLLLLRDLPDLPAHRSEARTLLHLLKKLRRAAGDVRDMDVHHERLKEMERSRRSQSEEAVALREQIQQLIASQEARREKAAARLSKLLAKRETEIATALEALQHALKPADAVHVPATDLLALAEKPFRKLYRRTGRAAKKRLVGKGAKGARPASDEHLHDLRKAAKATRYMAESAPGSERARTHAARFESLQEAGGLWHDWLELTNEAREEFGRKNPLTQAIKTRCQHFRELFVAALAEAA